MMFRRIGGAPQLALRNIDDLACVLELDEALWAVTGIAIDALRTDRQFLDFIDDDHNGVIRADEVKRAVAWFLANIRPGSTPALGSPDLCIDSINVSTPEGAALRAAANVVLRNLGIPDSPTLNLAQIRDDDGILSNACCNGDGVITPGCFTGDCRDIAGVPEDPHLAEIVGHIMKITGSCKDLTGEEGINREILDSFCAGAEKYIAWYEAPANQPELLRPYAEETANFSAMVEKLQDPIDRYFLHCAALEFLPELSRPVPANDETGDASPAASVRDLLEKLPVATPRPDRILDFSAPLNPLYETELRAFAAHPAMAEFLSGNKLSEAMWHRLSASLAAYREWKNSEPDKAFEAVETATLKQWLADGSLEELRRRIEEDLTVATELTGERKLGELFLFGKRGFFLSAIPVLMGVAFFIIKSFGFGNWVHTALCILLYLAVAVIYSGTVLGFIRTKWLLPPLFGLPFLYHIFVEDLAKLRDAANPMTLSQGLQELSVLCVMVSLFCVGMGLKKRTDTGAEAGNRKPEAKETAEPAAGEAAAEEPAAGPQEVPAAEDAE